MSKKIKHYFAASNGYHGFKSYFKNIFNPIDFDRIFILKGGPGTGKSSLMKKITNTFQDKATSVEAFKCSSDPSSLDGVILVGTGAKIAIIDGTSPHMTDPVLPGCIDKIINLGDFWNSGELSVQKKEITRLSKAKSDAYNHAYQFLELAGSATDYIDKIINRAYTKESLYSSNNTKYFSGRLISSFSKNGYSSIDEMNEEAEKVCRVIGLYGSEYFYMNELFFKLQNSEKNVILYPNALDNNKIEYIYDTNEKTAYVTGGLYDGRADTLIDTSKHLDGEIMKDNRSRLEFMWQKREEFLWVATDEFKHASDNHFALEKIYTSSMNFGLIEELTESLIKEIEQTLD